MITDRIENIGKYSLLFSGVSRLIKILESKQLSDINSKESIDGIDLIPIFSDSLSAIFDESVLEAHKILMDIHITLEGTDIIAYADLKNEATIFQGYDETNDYLLAKSSQIKIITVPKGYFCIIPNNFAHMALYDGHANVKKVVVKMQDNFKE